MPASQNTMKIPERLRWGALLIFRLLLILLIVGCSTPTATLEANVLLTPDINNPTATPFKPDNGANNSVYENQKVVPTATPTMIPAQVTPATVLVEENLLPTPLPSGYQDVPVFVPATNTNPLTGLTASDPGLLERRPMAIKITQYPRLTRPQSGLTLADVVYEYYIEDGLTRFIAIFYGNDAPQVGPVRSGRFFDEHITRMYQAFFVFKYADPRVYDYFKESDFSNYLIVPGNGSCPPFFVGDYDRDTYNNVFFNTIKFRDCIAKRKSVDNLRPPLYGSFFSSLPPKSDQVVGRIFTQYSLDDYNYWQYVPDTNRYQRYQEVESRREGDGASYELLTDAITNLPVEADNIVVLFVLHRFQDQFQEEDEVYHIDLYESGDAYVFRDGIMVKATWHRKYLDQPIALTSSQGAPIYLKPGVTFYQVIGMSSEHWQEGTDRHFKWQSP
jgi:hypothetical protein